MTTETSKNLPGDLEDTGLESQDRRDTLQKFGKYAAYAAPFTLLALAQKADAGTTNGHPRH